MKDKEEIRNEMLQIVKVMLEQDPPRRTSQINSFVEPLRNKIRTSQIPPQEHWKIHNFVHEIVNEWFRSGMIYFGKPDDSNQGYPFFTVTDFGVGCIISGNFVPYDPEGYIRELQIAVPEIDSTTLIYIRESIATYNSNHLLSSTITLGAASENMILSLIDSFLDSISDTKIKSLFEKKMNDRSIFRKYRSFRDELGNFNNKLPSNLTQDLEVYLDQTFQFARINRNNAGHPSGVWVNKRVAYSNLQIFAEYSRRIFDLIDFFNKNKI